MDMSQLNEKLLLLETYTEADVRALLRRGSESPGSLQRTIQKQGLDADGAGDDLHQMLLYLVRGVLRSGGPHQDVERFLRRILPEIGRVEESGDHLSSVTREEDGKPGSGKDHPSSMSAAPTAGTGNKLIPREDALSGGSLTAVSNSLASPGSVRKIPLSSIDPNPYRNLERVPLVEERVRELVESIQSTRNWHPHIVRERSRRYQIPYGHHRLEALRRIVGADAEVEVHVHDLSDEQMIQMMSRENMAAPASSVQFSVETIRSTVKASGDGKIALPPMRVKTKDAAIRIAPSFRKGCSAGVADDPRRYTAQSLAEFLGWVTSGGEPQDRLLFLLSLLELEEDGKISADEINGFETLAAVKARLDREKSPRSGKNKEKENKESSQDEATDAQGSTSAGGTQSAKQDKGRNSGRAEESKKSQKDSTTDRENAETTSTGRSREEVEPVFEDLAQTLDGGMEYLRELLKAQWLPEAPQSKQLLKIAKVCLQLAEHAKDFVIARKAVDDGGSLE